MPPQIKAPLAPALLRSVFSVYLVFAISLTLLQMGLDYQVAKKRVAEGIGKVESTFRPILEEAVWHLNMEQLQKMTAGIAQLANISGVSVSGSDGTVLAQTGQIGSEEKQRLKSAMSPPDNFFRLSYAADLSSHTFTLNEAGPDRAYMGSVTLYSHSSVIFDQVKVGFLLLMLNAVIKSIVLWLVFLFFLKRILQKPLVKMMQQVSQIDLAQLNVRQIDIGLAKPNELKVLESVFNQLLDKLYQGYQVERSLLEKQLTQSAKMASIGELTAGIAHEINNPLAIVSGYMAKIENLTRSGGHLNAAYSEAIAAHQRAVNRISMITKGLTLYSRTPAQEQVMIIDVHQVLRETGKMLTIIYEKEGVILELALLATQFWIAGDSGKLQQVFFNLVGNAKDAMGGKTGVIGIETANPNGHELTIKIRDEGPGIPLAIIDQIFHPFFTTKPAGKGTGLGLGITFNLVKSMNGTIAVHETGKGGSTFLLTFLTQAEDSSPDLAPDAPDAFDVSLDKSGLKYTCLLVDDEADLRSLLLEELTDMGLQVETAANGKLALALIQENVYDFILSDLTMPVMNGLDLLAAVKSPGTFKGKFIIFSGNSFASLPLVEIETIQRYADGFLSKPFDVADLVAIMKKD